MLERQGEEPAQILRLTILKLKSVWEGPFAQDDSLEWMQRFGAGSIGNSITRAYSGLRPCPDMTTPAVVFLAKPRGSPEMDNPKAGDYLHYNRILPA